MREVQRFFTDYKLLENKSVKVEQMGGVELARKVVREALELYQNEENKLRGWR